jgi:Tol biopolymer transport system component
MRRLSGDTASVRLAGFPGGEWAYRFSPDGRWLAYSSDESGQDEVYVRPFPGPGGRVQISADGGTEPVWSPDGKKVFYRSADATEFFAASLAFTPMPSVTARAKLFAGPYQDEWDVADYDVTRDGKQLIVVRPLDGDRKIVVVLNYATELRERFPKSR